MFKCAILVFLWQFCVISTVSLSLKGGVLSIEGSTDFGFFGSGSGTDEYDQGSGIYSTSSYDETNGISGMSEDNEMDKRFRFGDFQISENPADIKFLLFSDPRNENTSEELAFENIGSVKDSKFNPSEKTIFIIHGFWSNSTSGMPVTIRRGFLEAHLPYNLIVVDWGKLSSPEPKRGIFAPIAYPVIVKRNIPIVFERVAGFIQLLLNEKLTSLDKIHIIGHSLGAHISGGVGTTVALNPENQGKKIARITGLDPAGPLFQAIRVQRRLHKSDADFVDVYHTAAGSLGTVIYDEGDADFMPNGGHHQPGCMDMGKPLLEAEFGSCSHSFASKIYAASITRNFTACKCEPKYFDFVFGNSCPGNCSESVLAGYPCPPNATGQFYFETPEDPFAEGEEEETQRKSDEGE